jgi:sugar phosphate isomerase/epimerase
MRPIISITSDYVQSTGDPEPYLRRIAEAGFTHVHWCYHWFSDFQYSPYEVAQIARWMDEFGLAVLNIHASSGLEKVWGDLREYVRLSGVELVMNRIQMAADLHSDVVILHIPEPPKGHNSPDSEFARQCFRSMDTLTQFARSRNVRIALENMSWDDYVLLDAMFSRYSPDVLGLCFDCGHANMGTVGIRELELRKERLLAVHLHDNDGKNDQHKIPFTGTIDWGYLMKIIAASPYRAGINLEAMFSESGFNDEAEFLKASFRAGRKLFDMAVAEINSSSSERIVHD